MTVAQEFIRSSGLAEWTRGFARETLTVCENPSVEEVRAAIAAYLPQQLAEMPTQATVEQLLVHRSDCAIWPREY